MKKQVCSPLGLMGLLTLLFCFPKLHAVNLALNRPVYTSSNYNSSYTGTKAVDGTVSAASKWTSDGNSSTSYMYVDLGSQKSISSVVVKHAGAAGEWTSYNTSNFGIYTWNGSGWDLRSNVSGNTNSVTTHNFSATARYVLLQIWDAGIDNYARIPEMEVHSGGGSGGCNIVLNASGTSSIKWTFANSQFSSRTCGTISAGCGTNDWNVTCSSGCGFHIDDDYYADDWIRYNSQDQNISCGENVYAPFAGTVLYAGRLTYSYGRTVIIRSTANNGFAFRVAHLQSISGSVTTGGSVSEGQYLGKVGDDDGTSNGETSNFGCHAHAVLYKNINNSTALANLGGGHAPSGDIGSQTSATTYAAPYYLDATCSNKQGGSSQDLLVAGIQALQCSSALNQLEIYPHPIQGQATVRWEQQGHAPVKIAVVNLMGQTVKEIQPRIGSVQGIQSLSVSFTDLKSGIYFLKLQSGNETLTKKITVIQN